MKTSRRMQRLMEAKITHSIITGKLPHIVRPEDAKPSNVKPQSEEGSGNPS